MLNHIIPSSALSGTPGFFEEVSNIFQAQQSSAMLINFVNIHIQTFCLGTHACAHTEKSYISNHNPD